MKKKFSLAVLLVISSLAIVTSVSAEVSGTATGIVPYNHGANH